MSKKVCISFLAVLVMCIYSGNALYSQENEKQNSKMEWWDDAKFGLFIHWGLYSIPAGTWEGVKMNPVYGSEWILNILRIKPDDYKKLAPKFNPLNFDPEKWVLLAKEAGMKYIVFTAKHCDGFAMFKSQNPFNVVDSSPYKQDIVKALAAACKKYNMPFGLYYSQAQDWFHPGGGAYEPKWDKAQEGKFEEFINKVSFPQVKEIMENYQPRILWFDTPAQMTPQLAMKFTDYLQKYPDLIINDRLGVVNGDYSTPEQYIPQTGSSGKRWESCMTMNGTWGYNADDHNWKSPTQLIRNLVEIASKGGNFLLNVGPDATGVIPQPSVEVLKSIGKWLSINGESIYGAKANPLYRQDWGYITQKSNGKETLLYLHVFDRPQDNKLMISGLSNKVKALYALNNKSKKIAYVRKEADLIIDLSRVTGSEHATVIVLKIEGTPQVVLPSEIHSLTQTFIDTVYVQLDAEQGKVHYTTDGSIPSERSPLAQKTLAIVSDTNFVLKVAVFRDNKRLSGISQKTFNKTRPIPSLCSVQPGVKYTCYEGIWGAVPDFSVLTPIDRGVLEKISLDHIPLQQNFGIVFEGFLNINKTDIYKFTLASDDGSKLFVGDTLVIDNDLLHGMDEVQGEVALKKGLHPFKLYYFQRDGGRGLRIRWESPNSPASGLENLLVY